MIRSNFHGGDIATKLPVAEFAGRLGVYDYPCPVCSPRRSTPAKRNSNILRVWHQDPGFVTFQCVKCDQSGILRLNNGKQRILRARPALPPAPEQRSNKEQQVAKARELWGRRQPVGDGSIIETYLRENRRYSGLIPATIGYLPPIKSGQHPAMIAAFGLAEEIEPGVLSISAEAVKAVHLTLLQPNGCEKAGTGRDKIMIGAVSGSPICLAPCNDLLGLVVCEGIEDALSIFQSTGLGVWASGSAPHMRKLASVVPEWVDCVTIVADPDDTGQAAAASLKAGLEVRGFTVGIKTFWEPMQ